MLCRHGRIRGYPTLIFTALLEKLRLIRLDEIVFEFFYDFSLLM